MIANRSVEINSKRDVTMGVPTSATQIIGGRFTDKPFSHDDTIKVSLKIVYQVSQPTTINLPNVLCVFAMASKLKMNVQSFPRPPRLEKVPRHLQIVYKGQTIADTKEACWALETHHPPTYYLPRSSVSIPLVTTRKKSFCEWKGMATYYTVQLADGKSIVNQIWSYEQPTPSFERIRGYLSFYAEPWDCFVDGEKVEPQPGDFYGGWVTSEIEGIVKGRTGNLDPIV